MMLNQWINRLVKSESRRKRLLRKPRIAWPTVLHTGDHGTLKGLSLQHGVFPERIQLQIELRPNMLTQLSITAQSSLDTHECLAVPIYQQLAGNQQRIYGRCESIDLILKGWNAVKEEMAHLTLSSPIGSLIYVKEFYTCPRSIVERNTIVDHKIVNVDTRRKHIYPYGGYLSPDGIMGDVLYMTLSFSEGHTVIHTHTYSDLLHDHINPFEEDGIHTFTDIDLKDRHKILPLNKLIEYGELMTCVNLMIGEDIWTQSYQSESFIRKDGTYEAIIIFRKTGHPKLGDAE